MRSSNEGNTTGDDTYAPPAPFLDFTHDPDLVQVVTIPSCEYALKGVQNTLHVLFQVRTGKKSEVLERPACDLAVVLDRSGSMEGEKLCNSKAAINQLIRNLSHNDKLHLIAYDSKSEVIFADGDLSKPDVLHQLVDEIVPLGATNLYAGLKKGAKTLKKYKVEGSSRTQRIFLFSDGLVNQGKKLPDQIKKLVKKIKTAGISISSFGIGSSFDEELMKSISEHGSGDYFFIENAAVIPKHVEKGLRGLLSLVGTDAVLKIRGKNGGIVKQIYAHDNIIAGAQLGDLKQNNLRQIVSVVAVEPSQGEGNEVLTWSLSYSSEQMPTTTTTTHTTTATATATTTTTTTTTPTPTILQGSLYIKFTDNDELVLVKHPAVEVARTMQEIGDSDLEVLKLLDSGKKQEAIDIKKKDLAKLIALEPLDSTGTIKVLREKTDKSLSNLMSQTADIKEVRKEVHYNGYLQRRNSAYAIFD